MSRSKPFSRLLLVVGIVGLAAACVFAPADQEVGESSEAMSSNYGVPTCPSGYAYDSFAGSCVIQETPGPTPESEIGCLATACKTSCGRARHVCRGTCLSAEECAECTSEFATCVDECCSGPAR